MAGLQNYHEAYLICRDLGHAWSENKAVKSRYAGKACIVRVLNCPRCTGTRIDSYNSKGELVHREYRLPEGYKLDFRPLSAEVRAKRFKVMSLEQDNNREVVEAEVIRLGRAIPRARSERLKVAR